MILVDTHVVWLAFDQDQISRKARAAIDDARNHGDGLGIFDITLLELSTLVTKGRIRLAIGLESFPKEVEARFVVLPISRRACVRAVELPLIPRIQRIALSELRHWLRDSLLLTADRAIRRSKALRTIW